MVDAKTKETNIVLHKKINKLNSLAMGILDQTQHKPETTNAQLILPKIKLIEGIIYLNPHMPILQAGSQTQNTIWKQCAKMLGKGSIMAPYLIDDRPQDGGIDWQDENDLWRLAKTGRNQWLKIGQDILESDLQEKYCTSDCSTLYGHYHLQVMAEHLSFYDWTWAKVHPIAFKNTNQKTLCFLWKTLNNGTISSVSRARQENEIKFKLLLRDIFISRFEFYWIDAEGNLVEKSKARFKNRDEVEFVEF